MVSFNKALSFTLGVVLVTVPPGSNLEVLERRDNSWGFEIGSFLQIRNPIAIVPELIQSFINEKKCISDSLKSIIMVRRLFILHRAVRSKQRENFSRLHF